MSRRIRVLRLGPHRRALQYIGMVPVVLAAGASLGSAATLVGRVYAENGNPVKNAFVTVQSTMAAISVQSKTAKSGSQYRSSTDDQGKFTFEIPDGAYTVCVRSDNRALLDSCQWFLSENIIRIQPGLPALKIVLRAGLRLRIRLNDPLNLWPADPRLRSAAFVRFTVYDGAGYPHPVAQVSGDIKGRNFEALVPPNQSYRVSVQSQGFDVVDEARNIASQAAAVAITTSKTDLAETRVYEIVSSKRTQN